ncbi:hypothetical protein, partial [Sinorhizobium meliloti]|uniref:hypothetical protein n=1 Tax=Rhizobium meliloti TaxID=382 RepID=UPI001AECD309
SLEEMAARPKAQTITERRTVAYVPPKTDAEVMPSVITHDVDFFFGSHPRKISEEHQDLSRIPPISRAPRCSYRQPIPPQGPRLRIQPRPPCHPRRHRERDHKAFRKFRTLAGPNTRIQDDEVFNLLSAEAKAALDHLQALIDAARILREANGVIVEAAICLHNAGAAATRATA